MHDVPLFPGGVLRVIIILYANGTGTVLVAVSSTIAMILLVIHCFVSET